VTLREAAVEVLRTVVEELEPAGTELDSQPPWLRAALRSRENALALEAEVRALTGEARRLAAEIVRQAEKRAGRGGDPVQLELLGGRR
jgi:hypothetical protein